MRRLVVKTSVFLCGLAIMLLACVVLPSKSTFVNSFLGKITNSSSYSREATNGGPTEIIPSIELAQEKSQHTKLVLGDSVCFRLFRGLQDVNDEYLLLGTNQAVGMTGQYLLAEQFIINHDNVTDIYLIMIDGSFDFDYGVDYGYQYAIMPFVETDLFYRLDPISIKAAEDMFGEVFLRKDIVELIDYSDTNRKLYLNYLSENAVSPVSSKEYTSDIVAENLKRLQSLCVEKDIKLHVLPGPMPETEERKELLVKQEEEFVNRGMGELMKSYYDCVSLYPTEYFPDGVHPGGDYGTREALNKMILTLQEKSGLLEGVILTE